MIYRDILSQYREGKLDEQTEKEVKAEIDKFEALSEYTFDTQSIPELDEAELAQTDGETDISDKIGKTIRRAFIKMGLIVGITILAVVLFVIFALPKVVSSFYYDPTKTVGTLSGADTNKISLDFSVFSELFVPCRYRNSVIAEPEGYGTYAVVIPQTVSYTGSFKTVNGKLTRGRLNLYDLNTFRLPTSNAFVLPEKYDYLSYCTDENGNKLRIGAAGTYEMAYETVSGLPDDRWYRGYVSFEDVMDYADFNAWIDSLDISFGDLWCGVLITDNAGKIALKNAGFSPNASGVIIDWDREKYPALSLNDGDLPDVKDTALIKTHFISLLTYMKDNAGFYKTVTGYEMDCDFDYMIDKVNAEGIGIYGFAVLSKADTLRTLFDDPNVSYIYTEPAD